MRSPSGIALQIVELARRQRALLMAELQRVNAASISPEALCDRMSLAMNQYGTALMGTVAGHLDVLTSGDRDWIRTEYLTWMFEFATAACTLTRDPASRHEVAQTLQCAILSQEQRLRTLLDGAAPTRLASDCRDA
ncbi:MAG TPA: hypothetical protein VF147_03360 [Vicinamibacterales bacterium]